MKLKINVVDAFTETQFGGNSAAVIITKDWLKDNLMQLIALENNLAETAYLVKVNDDHYKIRWFSPTKEVEFCGHATLAAAFVIFKQNPQLKNITIYAKAVGSIIATKTTDNYIEMAFPNRKPEPVANIAVDLLSGLSIKPSEVLINSQAYFAVYKNETDVINVKQNKEYLKKLAPHSVVVTAKSTKYDFVSRYFCGDEDAVTGSIHTGLAPFWAEKLTKTKLIAYQASSRGGVLLCRVNGAKVFIAGKAIPYLEGYINV